MNEPGALIWNQLRTTDPEGAGTFYRAVLGLEAAPFPDMPEITGFHVKGRPIGDVQDMGDLPGEIAPHWTVHFAVDDTDSTVDALVRAGGSVVVPPFDMEKVGRMALVQDPQGAAFSVITPRGPESS